MSVVGFDIGNLQSVVAVARNRGIDIVANEVSNRATPTMISFGTKQRYIGESAKTQEMSNFKNTIGAIKRLIGRSYNESEVQQFESQFIGCKLCDVNGEVGVEVNYLDEPRKFSATQLYAMYLGKLRDTASKELGGSMSDVVISVPGWYTDRQRRAVQQASKIAGLNCLRVLNDNTAAALGYGITKNDLPEDKPRNVVFVDLGHSSFTVSVVAFKKGELKVKSVAYDRGVGGRNFDQALTDHFIQVFDEKYKIDIRSNVKAQIRLRAACEKLKKVLSANSNAPITVENIMNDVDANALYSRDEFVALIEPLLQRLEKPIQKAIADASVSADEIHSIELVGGSIRIPAVKQKLTEFFGRELSYTLNQDEAVARGCALQCAIASPVFRVRDFSVNDITAHPIRFKWEATDGSEDTNLDVFAHNNLIPSTKMLTFYRKQPFAIEAEYSDPTHLPQGTNPWISRFDIKDVVAQENGDLSTIKVKARLDLSGVLNITSAYTVEEVEVEEPVPQPETKEGEEPKTPEMRKVKKLVKKAELPVLQASQCLDNTTLAEFAKLEREMHSSDELVNTTEIAKNSLEEYIYDIRGKVEGEYAPFIEPKEKNEFLSKLNSAEDWLYDEGEDTTKDAYVEKLESLKAVGDPVTERYREDKERPKAARELRDVIAHWADRATSQEERYAHINQEERQKVIDRIEKVQEWLDERLEKQSLVKKWDAPVVFSSEIKKERENLVYFASPIMSRPKPAEPKPEETASPKPEGTPKSDTAADAAAASNEEAGAVNEMDVD
ncbi:adenyl-nucleotide exchange factor sse1 [Coemansia spiralis]|uniref:Adenyl-nucleotide exchange factor sse1 n=2 Tax=Coemansia TaxID=4863 RepID=A0A9W8GA67_9FUNG|nr:heat shock protein 70 family [Coemansia spiralis]KAJ1992255.1 adenyl-nucleotide exchange factor sse1 [Coemansia umbellata]KAJ2623369.1 adenyl-nucleotide exchange factor sse1 [Coemansia sp. RSA 1358]KAJ2678084.1 adenyl-nucleotide exchange factor sse1 [Coemansia spiralis]